MEDDEIMPFTLSDEPFDGDFDLPYFSLYGVDAKGIREHIADRRTYFEAVNLAKKLIPGIVFPISPSSNTQHATD
jgi:hypothetical protein